MTAMTDTEQKQQPRMASVREAMRYGGFRRTRFYELIALGQIKAVKDGARTKIDLNSIDRYYDSLPNVPSAPIAPTK